MGGNVVEIRKNISGGYSGQRYRCAARDFWLQVGGTLPWGAADIYPEAHQTSKTDAMARVKSLLKARHLKVGYASLRGLFWYLSH